MQGSTLAQNLSKQQIKKTKKRTADICISASRGDKCPKCCEKMSGCFVILAILRQQKSPQMSFKNKPLARRSRLDSSRAATAAAAKRCHSFPSSRIDPALSQQRDFLTIKIKDTGTSEEGSGEEKNVFRDCVMHCNCIVVRLCCSDNLQMSAGGLQA